MFSKFNTKSIPKVCVLQSLLFLAAFPFQVGNKKSKLQVSMDRIHS